MNLGGAVLDLPDGLLLNGQGETIPLRAQSMKVLRVLAQRAGEVVTKDELFEAVWGEARVSDDSLTQCVGEIRRAIGDVAHRVILTVPRRGYRLMPLPEKAPGRKAVRMWRAPVALTLVGALGLAGWWLWPVPASEGLPTNVEATSGDLP